MIVPAPPSSFFPPLCQSNGDAIGLWSQSSLERQESEVSSNPDFPPLKKQRQCSSDNDPQNHFQNPPLNPKYPPLNPPAIKGISKMFFKTRICEKFRQGTCPYGSNCNFAHGMEEIRKPPPNWKELVAAHEDERGPGNWAEHQKMINRLRICRKFYYGEGCPYGDKCNFLHEEPERVRDSAAVTVCSTGNWSDDSEGNVAVNSIGQENKSSDAVVISVMDNSKGSGGVVVNCGGDNKSVFYKTRICIKWDMTGHCPFGDKCHFAHGPAELQKFGGANSESESNNVIIAPPKPPPVSTNFVSPSKTLAPSCKLQTKGFKRFAKLNGPGLISHVYADWIDDIQHLDR